MRHRLLGLLVLILSIGGCNRTGFGTISVSDDAAPDGDLAAPDAPHEGIVTVDGPSDATDDSLPKDVDLEDGSDGTVLSSICDQT